MRNSSWLFAHLSVALVCGCRTQGETGRAPSPDQLAPPGERGAPSDAPGAPAAEAAPTSCAAVLCAPNSRCDASGGSARCVPIATTQCGANTCSADTFCCNESCGICAPVGGSCTQQFCGKE